MAVPTVPMLGPSAGCVHINGVDYKPTNGIYAIPQNLVPQAEMSGLEIITAKSSAAVPTANDVPPGAAKVWKNSGDGTVKLYYNDAGTMKSVTLV